MSFSPSFYFSSVPPAKMSPRISGRQNEHIVPDYPTNNKISTKEALKTLNNASGDVTLDPHQELQRSFALIFNRRNKHKGHRNVATAACCSHSNLKTSYNISSIKVKLRGQSSGLSQVQIWLTTGSVEAQ